MNTAWPKIRIAGIWLALFLFSGVFLDSFSPPTITPQSAPPSAFSAERAMVHLRHISQRPHSTGTVEHEHVKEYIVSQMRALGLQVDVQTETAMRIFKDPIVGRIQNIIAVLKGKKSAAQNREQAIGIMAHYDTQPHTPGAGDDGAGVAAMLETARALKSGPVLKRDVVFLFSDAEEVGLLGSHACVEQHPLCKRIGIVLNLEGRGNKGLSLTFEVSPGNGRIMREYLKAVPNAFASSLMYELYQKLPNATDFMAFKESGILGFNVAFVEGFAYYHSALDNADHLDPRSLQHHGDHALGFARHFGNLSLEHLQASDVMFFNIPFFGVVLVPDGELTGGLIVLFILWGGFLFLGWRRTKVRLFECLLGGFGIVTAFGVALLGCTVAQWITLWLYPSYLRYYGANFFNAHWYFLSFSALGLTLYVFFLRLLWKRIRLLDVAVGYYTCIVALILFLLFWMRTAIYFLALPLLFSLGAWLVCFLFNIDEQRRPWLFTILHLLPSLIALALFLPLVKLLFVGFGLERSFLGVFGFLLMCGFLVPQIFATLDSHRFALPLGALAICLVCFVLGHAWSSPTRAHPLQSNLMYCADVNKKRALWVSSNQKLDDWNQKLLRNTSLGKLSEIFPDNQMNWIKNQAPYRKLPTPEVEIIQERHLKSGRYLLARISSPRHATMHDFYLYPDEGLTRLIVDGKIIDRAQLLKAERQKPVHFSYIGMGNRKVELAIETLGRKPLKMVVVERKIGFDEVKDLVFPMPPHIIPDTDYYSSLTVLKKKVVL